MSDELFLKACLDVAVASHSSEPGIQQEPAPPRRPAAAPTVEVALLSMGGESLARREVAAGCTLGELRKDLAESLGFPVEAMKLLDGAEELGADYTFWGPPRQRSLSLLLVIPSPHDAFNLAVRRGQHGYVAAMLQRAGAGLRRYLLLHCGALHEAALNSLETLEVLLQAAAEDDILEQCLVRTNLVGCTALHRAAGKHLEAARRLLEAAEAQGCGRRLLLLGRDNGATALHYAAGYEQLEAVELLLALAKQTGALRPLLLAEDELNGTALHGAAKAGHAAVLRALLFAAREEGSGLLEELLAARSRTGETLRQCAERDPTGELLPVIDEAGGAPDE